MRAARFLAVLSIACSAATSPGRTGEVDSSPERSRAPADPAPAAQEPLPAPREVADSSAAEARGSRAPDLVLGPATLSLGERPPWEAERAPLPPVAPGTWRLKKTLRVGVGYLQTVELSPTGEEVYVLSQDDGILRRYETKTGRLVQQIEAPGFEQFDTAGFAVVEDGLCIATKNTAYWFDLGKGTLERAPGLPAYPEVLAAPQRGLFGFSHRRTEPQSGDLLFGWIDANRSFRVALGITCSERPDAWALSPDGRMLAIHYYPSNGTHVIDLMNGGLIATIESPRWGGTVAISPDGTLMALGGEELRIHRFPSGELIDADRRYGNNIGNLRFTPQGDQLLVAAFDGKARSYPLGASTERLPRPQILAHAGTANVYGLGLSADGRTLATSSGDQTVKIWVR